jgi:hypothetical protein
MAEADALAEKTRDWLIRNPREVFDPIPFFESVWSKSNIVTFGERHDDAAQRALVAAVVKQVGGPDVGLALEIEAKYQTDIARFIAGGGKTPGPPFAQAPIYSQIFRAARDTKTEIVAMDANQNPLKSGELRLGSGGVNRDQHMADAVLSMIKRKKKVLVLVGMLHAAEAGVGKVPQMGKRLVTELGDKVFTIYAMTLAGHGKERFFQVMKQAFPNREAIAFHVDKSPLGTAEFIDVGKSVPWKDYCDGVMLFFKQ